MTRKYVEKRMRDAYWKDGYGAIVDVALALVQERADAVRRVAEAMRDCPNGMCGHCIELLCEELLPLVAARKPEREGGGE